MTLGKNIKKNMPTGSLIRLLVCICLVLFPSQSFAACVSPAGNAGDIGYSSTQNIMVYCNGTNWIAMGASGSATFGTVTVGNVCTATATGTISCTTPTTGSGNAVLSTAPTLNGITTFQNGTAAGGSDFVELKPTDYNSTTPFLFMKPSASSWNIGLWNGSAIYGTLNFQVPTAAFTGTVSATSFSGSGASLTSIGTASLGGITGTPSSTTYLRGDGTWSTIAGMVYPAAGIANSTGSAWGTSYSTSGSGTVLALTASPTFTGTVTGGTFSGTHTGIGSGLTGIGTASLGGITGTPSSTTFLRGDGTWGTVGTGSGTVTSSTAGQVAYFQSSGTTVIGTSTITISGGQVGIGTSTTTAGLTVNGTSAFQYGTNYTTIGTQQAVAINASASVRYTGASAATFNGIVAGANGQVLYLHNGSTATLTLSNKNAAETTVANQIVTGTGADLAVAANSAVILQYDTTATNSSGATGAWRIIGGSGGGGTPGGSTTQVQFNNASAFGGDAKLTWDNTNKILAAGTGAATPVGTTGTVAGVTVNVIPQAVAVTASAPVGGLTFSTAATGQMAYFSGTSAVSGTPNVYVSGGYIGVGTATPTDVLHIADQNNTGVRFDEYNSSDGASIRLRRAKGTFASPTGLIVDDRIGAITGFGYNSAAAFGTVAAQYGMYASETHTSTAHGSYLRMDTTPNGSLSAAERVRIDQNGYVGIGTTVPQSQFQVGAAGTASWQPVGMGPAYYAGGGPYNTSFIGFNLVGGSNSYTTGTDSGNNGAAAIYGSISGDMLLATVPTTGGTQQTLTGTNLASDVKMIVKASGNVGIGSTSPAVALDVAGSINATGTVTATHAGNGASLTSLNASNLSSGTVGTARLGSGTANSTTFLRGDNTWAAAGGGISAATSASCFLSSGSSCTATCAAGYYLTGCAPTSTAPGSPTIITSITSGLTGSCSFTASSGIGSGGTQYAICAK